MEEVCTHGDLPPRVPPAGGTAAGGGMNPRQGAIQSMTGYGRASRRAAGGSVTGELRSTNHRYLEVDQRLPNGFTAVQGRLTELIQKRLHRGRVEVLVFIQAGPRDRPRGPFH